MKVYKITLPDEVVEFLKRSGYDPVSFLRGQLDLLWDRLRRDLERRIVADSEEAIRAVIKFVKDNTKIEED